MKYLIILMILTGFTSCASSPLDVKRKDTLTCVKDLIANGATTEEAYAVCKDVYAPSKSNTAK
jgi:hypothetical protein